MTDQIDNAETSAPETPEAEAPELDMEQEPAAAAPASVTAPKAEEAPKSEYQVSCPQISPENL